MAMCRWNSFRLARALTQWTVSMEALVNALVIFVLALLLALVPAWVLWRSKVRPKGWRYLALTSYHAFFCLLLVLLLNGLPGFFVQNSEVYANVRLLEPDATAVQRPIVLIDNSGNKQLVPDPDGNLEDSTVLVVTDRAKLARLLHRLAEHQEHIGQVVVDIQFVDPSPADSALREAVLDLAVHGKVLLARAREENTDALRFGSDVMADVTEHQQEDLIAWHRSARAEGHSLPYTLFLRLHHRNAEPFALRLWKESGGDAPARLVFPGFMPTWSYLPTAGEEPVGRDVLPMPIGHALDAGWDRLLRRLTTADGPAPVIFIGEFPAMAKEASSDVHRTYLGEHTGSAMLINLFHELERGAHVVKGSTLLILFGVLMLCTAWTFFRAWPGKSEPPPTTFGAIVGKYVEDALKNLIPFVLLIVVVWAMRRITGQQMNLPPLLLYFAALTSLVEAIRRVRQRERDLANAKTDARP